MQDGGGTADLERLLADRGGQLLRTAVLLAGSHQDGEDLLQAGLERLLRRRRRIEGSPEEYLRRTLYNLAADGWRRQGAWRTKLPVIRASHSPAEPDLTAAVDLRDALMRILRLLPPQQRAVIVLRYWEQLSQAETAAALGCSEGTVKASRGSSGCATLPVPGWPRRSGRRTHWRHSPRITRPGSRSAAITSPSTDWCAVHRGVHRGRSAVPPRSR